MWPNQVYPFFFYKEIWIKAEEKMRKLLNKTAAFGLAAMLAVTPVLPEIGIYQNAAVVEAAETNAGAKSAEVDTSWYSEDKKEFEISTAAQFRGISQLISDKRTMFQGCTIKLSNDIDLENKDYTPIGTGFDQVTTFQGIFDGQGHTIKNISYKNNYPYNNQSLGYTGLFKALIGSEDNIIEIKNLTLENISISINCTGQLWIPNSTDKGVGALFGEGAFVNISNCHVKKAHIYYDNGNVGGLFGAISNDSVVSDCSVLETTVKSDGANIGLLGGKIAKSAKCSINDVTVGGTVEFGDELLSGGGYRAGGVIGQIMSSGDKSTTVNNAQTLEGTTVEASSYAGGIVGVVGVSQNNVTNVTLNNCINRADITATLNNVAGISSFLASNLNISNCINMGDIKGADYAAGIAASQATGTPVVVIANSYNTGGITATGSNTDELGSAAVGLTIKNCLIHNTDKITFPKNNTYSNTAYRLWDGAADSPDGRKGFSDEELRDRTAVEYLNMDNEAGAVWCQNTDYPDLASNMTLISEITVPEPLEIEPGKTAQIEVKILPEDATVKTIFYTSSDESVAEVDANGVVTGVKEGTAEITVTALDSGMSETVKVVVKATTGAETPVGPSTSVDVPTSPAPTTGSADVLKKGTTVDAGTNSYVITDETARTVAYAGTSKKKAAKVSVPETVTINNKVYKVTSISNKAFKNNKKLKTVVIGKNVTSIGKKAFYGCKNLKKITVKSKNLKKVGAKALKGINKKATIKVLAKKYKAYKKLFKGKGQVKTVKIVK